MDPGFVACIEAGRDITMADYQKTRLVKYAYCAERSITSSTIDFLLTPAVSVAAFRRRCCSRRIGRSIRGTGCRGRSSPIRSICRAIRRRRCRAASPRRACRSVCRSSDGGSTTSARVADVGRFRSGARPWAGQAAAARLRLRPGEGAR